MQAPTRDLSSLPFTTHVDTIPSLDERATRTPSSPEVVLTLTRLHRRNLRDRLRRLEAPQSAFVFAEPLGVARRLTDDTEANTECLDQIDRLHYSEELLAAARDEGREWYRDLAVSMGTKLTADPEAVERVRAAVETTTGFHPTRLTALRDTAAALDSPAREDALARIEAAVSLQAALAERTDVAATSDAVMRGASGHSLTTADAAGTRYTRISSE